MTRAEMMKELDRIIDVGIVNAHHDRDVLKKVRELVKDLIGTCGFDGKICRKRSCYGCGKVDEYERKDPVRHLNRRRQIGGDE